MENRDKIVSSDEAVALIRDGDSVSCSGFVGIGTPEELIVALERRFMRTQEPRDLTLIFAAAPGDGRSGAGSCQDSALLRPGLKAGPTLA